MLSDAHEAGLEEKAAFSSEFPVPPAVKLRCRLIGEEDLNDVADLLHAGFPRRSRSDFHGLLDALGRRPTDNGRPHYGHMLSFGRMCVGVLLTIASRVTAGSEIVTRCNVACWHVHPDYSMFGGMLLSRVLRDSPHITLNVSPARSTLPTIEAQGFRRLTSGFFAAIPLLSMSSGPARLVSPEAYDSGQQGFDAEQAGLFKRHTEYGCICLLIRSGDQLHPFIFRRRFVTRVPAPSAQLIYATDAQSLTLCAQTIGLALLRRGLLWMLVASDGPIAGVPGVYFPEKSPVYVRTKLPVSPYDLADTELALFGA